MKCRSILPTAISLTVLLASASFAYDKSDECAADEYCKLFFVQNSTLVVVTTVVVRRQSSSLEQCESEELRFQRNLLTGEGFVVEADERCRYEIVYKTTNGCLGDKKAAMTPAKLEDGENKVVLTGAGCGTLKAKTRSKFKGAFGFLGSLTD